MDFCIRNVRGNENGGLLEGCKVKENRNEAFPLGDRKIVDPLLCIISKVLHYMFPACIVINKHLWYVFL